MANQFNWKALNDYYSILFDTLRFLMPRPVNITCRCPQVFMVQHLGEFLANAHDVIQRKHVTNARCVVDNIVFSIEKLHLVNLNTDLIRFAPVDASGLARLFIIDINAVGMEPADRWDGQTTYEHLTEM